MADYLIEFIEGQTIKASEHNSNNQYLLDQLNDSIKTLNAKVSSLQSNIQTQLQAQLDQIFPIGCIHLSFGGAPSYGRWEQVAQDRVIQGAGSLWKAGDLPTQGLPGIYGSAAMCAWNYVGADGALAGTSYGATWFQGGYSSGPVVYANSRINFNAANSNSTYSQPQGRVQPYAYVVNVWKRVA